MSWKTILARLKILNLEEVQYPEYVVTTDSNGDAKKTPASRFYGGNIDGGSANSIELATQNIDGGSSSSLEAGLIDCGNAYN